MRATEFGCLCGWHVLHLLRSQSPKAVLYHHFPTFIFCQFSATDVTAYWMHGCWMNSAVN